MGNGSYSESSRVDVELPIDDGPVETTLASGGSYQVRLFPPRRWIYIDLVDEHGRPAAGEVYRIELPDGTVVREDKLDSNGCARVEGLPSDEYIITFPLLDIDAWSYLGCSEQQG